MLYYCTLFDSFYLHKGLALYLSLTRVCPDFHLYVLAFDQDCAQKLQELDLTSLTVVSLEDFETQELLNIKPERNKAEYCWTCGPSFIYYCIDKFNLPHCTYLDADMMFYSSPEIIYGEIGNNSVALTEHFNGGGDLEGKFCVQFVYFKNDEMGISALKWWRDKCIEWCYAKYEDGKYGDQKYLDDIPHLFDRVRVLKNRGAGVAPWNMALYNFPEYGKMEYRSQLSNIIFFHFHGTRIDVSDSVLTLKAVTYDIDKKVQKYIYFPYLELLKTIYEIYLNVSISSLQIEGRKWYERFYSRLKKRLRHNGIAQFVYYKILGVKYNGYEKKANV